MARRVEVLRRMFARLGLIAGAFPWMRHALARRGQAGIHTGQAGTQAGQAPPHTREPGIHMTQTGKHTAQPPIRAKQRLISAVRPSQTRDCGPLREVRRLY